jgi:uncharacterized protein involved in outer membrane biogenesis
LVKRFRRTLWVVLATVTLAFALAFVGWTLDPETLKPRLVEAAYRATGRTLTISGAMTIKLSFVPTVSMEDVTLSNPPGFSGPDMVKVARVELGLALLPLLRHEFEVDNVRLVRPEIQLETDKAGTPNWIFEHQKDQGHKDQGQKDQGQKDQGQTAKPSPEPSGGTAKPKKFSVAFKDASEVDGRVVWIDGKAGHRYVIDTPNFRLDAA